MSVEIMHVTPLSSEYTEVHFGEHFPFRLWVKFLDKNFEEWVGCFPKEYEAGFDQVLVDNSNQTAFVIAGGQGFLVDTINRKLLLTTDSHPSIQCAIKTNNPEYYIAGAYYSIYVVDTSANLKTVEPDFTTEGIFFTGQRENKAIGKLEAMKNQYEYPYDFELDLNTFELNLGENNKPSFWTRLFGK